MIKYDLAKQLKDAGFEQGFRSTYMWPDGSTNDGNLKDDSGELVAVPTLSELIEACGGYFGALVRVEYPHITDMPHCWCNPMKEVQPNRNMVIVHTKETKLEWKVAAVGKTMDDLTLPSQEVSGSTPEEAVANLWLALNKKNV